MDQNESDEEKGWLGMTRAEQEPSQFRLYVSAYAIHDSDIEDGDMVAWTVEDGKVVGKALGKSGGKPE